MRQSQLIAYKGISPKVPDSVYLANGVWVIGDVEIGLNSSVWFNTVLRGDVHYIRIGSYTNIQDNSLVHVQAGVAGTSVGDYVTVGHNVILHGCTVGNNCLIGMGAILLTGSEIGDNCIVGAGTLITEGKKVPSGSLVVGSPGRVIRKVTDEEIEAIRQSALHYHESSLNYIS